MLFSFKYFLPSLLLLMSCSEPSIIKHSYSVNNPQKNLKLEGTLYGLEEMDHYNTLQLSTIEHELVDNTSAKAKITGVVVGFSSNSALIKGDKDYFFIEIEEPLTLPKESLGKECLFQGLAQMRDSSEMSSEIKALNPNKKRYLHFTVSSMIVLK